MSFHCVNFVKGTGSAFAFTPSLMMLVHYFDKKRGTAIAIGTAGASFGAIVVSPFLAFSFDYYGYTGTMLLLAGLSFNLCVGGALLRPFVEKPCPCPSLVLSCRTVDTDEETQIASLMSIYDITGVTHMPEEHPGGRSSLHCVGPEHELSQMRVSSVVLNRVDITRSHSNENRHVTFLSTDNQPDNTPNTSHEASPVRQASAQKVRIEENHQQEEHLKADNSLHVPSQVQQVCTIHEPPSVVEVYQRTTPKLTVSEYTRRKSRMSVVSQKAESAWCSFKRAVALTKEPIVALFCVSIINVPVSLLCVLNFLPDTALKEGIDSKSAAFLVSMFGVTNLIGLPIWGMIYDTGFVLPRRRLVYFVIGNLRIILHLPGVLSSVFHLVLFQVLF